MKSNDLVLICERGEPDNTWLTDYANYKSESEYYELSDDPVRLHHYVEYIQSDLENWNYHSSIDIVENVVNSLVKAWQDEEALLELVKKWATERTWLP